MHLECIDHEGYVSTTNDFSSGSGSWNLAHQINYYCDGLIDQVKVVEKTGTYQDSD
jgi:hypothetical protein